MAIITQRLEVVDFSRESNIDTMKKKVASSKFMGNVILRYSSPRFTKFRIIDLTRNRICGSCDSRGSTTTITRCGDRDVVSDQVEERHRTRLLARPKIIYV